VICSAEHTIPVLYSYCSVPWNG